MTLDRPTRISANAGRIYAALVSAPDFDRAAFTADPRAVHAVVATAVALEDAVDAACRPPEKPALVPDLEDDVTPEQRRSA